MNNWDDLRFLVAVSKTGSMAGAARYLGTNTATVSRRIERLSETLGTAAFIKTADGWKPSDAVSHLIQLAQNFDGQIQSVLNAQVSDGPNEVLHFNIGCPPLVTSQILVPSMARGDNCLKGLAITFHDRIFGSGLGENDIVIQFEPPESGRVLTRKCGTMAMRFYRYIDGDSSGDWVGLPEEHDNRALMRMGLNHFNHPPKIRLSNFLALFHLMQASRLPGPLPESLAVRDPQLIPVVPDTPPHIAEFWLFYHESRRNDPGMRRAVDWIISCFKTAEALTSERPRDTP